MNPRLAARLNDVFLFAMMLVIAGILTFAMILQYRDGEIPCPLCLLQRVAMFGVCIGIILNFRWGYSARNDGISLLFALFLLIISARQTLLDIVPRPGHNYIGSTIFGIHMPVWSVIIAIAILLAFAIKMLALGGAGIRDGGKPQLFSGAAKLLSAYVIVICAINFVSVILQCGLEACHTTGYRFSIL
jgi:disulfide bond formation protein DsbB